MRFLFFLLSFIGLTRPEPIEPWHLLVSDRPQIPDDLVHNQVRFEIRLYLVADGMRKLWLSTLVTAQVESGPAIHAHEAAVREVVVDAVNAAILDSLSAAGCDA